MEENAFKSWLSKAADKKQARCRICKKDFELSNMDKKTLLSHAAGKKHSERDMKIKIFSKPANQKKITNSNTEFKSAENDDGSSSNCSTHVVDQCSKLVQPTLELVTTNSDKTKDVIIWALKCIESGYSDNSNNGMNVVFKCMLPDSKIAGSFQMGPDKLHYYVTFGLAPYFKSLLTDTLKKSDCHILSFDESLNNFTQTEMDLLARFFNNSTNT